MAAKWPMVTAILALIAFIQAAENSINSQKCDQSPLQAVFLFDISPTNSTYFARQQQRVIETIKHIDVLTQERSISFGFVVFHRLPVLLSPLNSPKSSDSSKVTEQVQSVRPRRHAEASPAKALDLAAEQIEKNGREGARSVVFLVHDGLSTDLIAETLEAVERLRNQRVEVFAITGSPNPNLLALSGYTHERNRIYAFDSDRIEFFASIDDIVGTCDEKTLPRISASIDSHPTSKDATAFFKFDDTVACSSNERVDLMIVLDTSGSVFNAFAEERKLAENLVQSLEPNKFEKDMQVGLVSFASEPNVLLPLRHGRTQESVAKRIQEIEFTGKNTRIADAVQMALDELESRKRNDSTQVFVLITDGHGQEYWSQAQSAGRKLQESNAQIFVATTSVDYNLPEMILYAGDKSRVFVGETAPEFLPKVSKFINKCIGETGYKAKDVSFGNSVLIKLNDTPKSKASADLIAGEKITVSENKVIPVITESSKSSEEKKESNEEITSMEKDVLKARADHLRKLLNEQKSLSKSSDCNTDIIFVVDRTQKSTFDFSQQLELASNVVQGIAPTDVTSGKIRLSLITFSKKSRTIVPLSTNQTLHDFASKLNSILPSHSTGDIHRGLDAAVDELTSNRRSDVRAVMIFVASGKVADGEGTQFDKAFAKFQAIKNVDAFALSLNPFNDIKTLEKLTGNKWKVFIDGRVRQFTHQVLTSIISCSLASGQKASNDSQEIEIEKVEDLAKIGKTLQSNDPFCGSNPVDFVVIFDISTSVAEDFDKQKQLVVNLVKQAPLADFGKRIKFGLTLFNQHAKTLISLNNSLSKDDIEFAIDRVEHSGGQTSAVTGIGQSLADIQQFRRTDANLIVLVVSDGNSRDGWSRVQKAGNALRKSGAAVYAVALSKERSIDELAVYTNSEKKVFTDENVELFVLSAKKVIFGCSKDEPKLADITIAQQKSGEIEQIESLDKVVVEAPPKGPRTTTIHPPLTTTAEIITTTGKPEYSLTATTGKDDEKHIPVLFSDDCSVDLAFIIDTSTSVSNEFQKQLQFAVDLVKRLPDDDFENRVKVAAISFFREAMVEFPFGKMRKKSEVLDGLFGIKHTGGSTSAVSGVKLAVQEIIRGRRKGARLMVVLISDGNSQDPWQEVVDAAQSLRDVNADVYAVTVSHDYFFRELELYAGNKWFVYIDARIRQFLDEAEMSVVECRNPSIPASEKDPAPVGPLTKLQDVATTLAAISSASSVTPAFPTPSPLKTCQQDIVDLVLIIDTSTSVEKEFYAEKNFALDLVKVLPEGDFDSRIRIALIKFDSKSKLQFTFGEKNTRNDVLYEIERIEHTGGQTSLVSGVSLALKQIAAKQRNESRLVTIIISDGNSQDEWADVSKTAKELKETGSEIYAVTLSEKYYFDELKEYTGNERHVYTDERIEEFIQDVGTSVVTCPGRAITKVTLAPTVEISVTPTTLNPESTTAPSPSTTAAEKPVKNEDLAVEAAEPEFALAKDAPPEISERMESQGVPTARCKYSKMDLIIILDASSSREAVFEHQRELALSLIERLPVNKDGTHVATGINSFTSSPVLRQTLGLGRDKLMVRHAIEDIKYRGGSTLTSKAVELAVKDLERGKRPDALQVVVLLNDGMSQDPWDKVLMASESLRNTGAERFGVALGDDVDLRELRHYIGNDDRIYRDGSTERFLSDVVALLNGGERDCPPKPDTEDSGFEPLSSLDDCSKPKLDIVVVFDSTGSANDNSKVNSNKYLLLDVLGSLPANDEVKVAIFSFGAEPKLEQEFTDPQKFDKIESLKVIDEKPSYAKAVRAGLDYYNAHKRAEARGVFLIVGDGESTDKAEDRSLAANLVRKAKGLECHAVHSGKEINEKTLKTFTGDVKHVYNYDRNADFAKELLRLATLGQTEQCVEARKQINVQASSDNNREEQTYSTSEPFAARQRLHDISGPLSNGLDTEKVVAIQKTTLRRAETTTPASTTTPKTTTQSPKTVATTTKASTKIKSTVKGEATSTTKKIPTTKPSTTERATTLETKTTQKKVTVAATKIPKTLKAASQISDDVATTKKAVKATTKVTAELETTTEAITRKPAKTLKRNKTTTKIVKEETTVVTTTSPKVTASTSSVSLTPTPSTVHLTPTTDFPVEPSTPHVPGCLIDLLVIIDSSGSVEETFNREKELISGIIEKLRIGPENARVALIKFAATEKVRTIVPFDGPQSKLYLMRALQRVPFSSGTTAIHSALLHAISEYSPLKGARPGKATPLAIIFTDGFSQRDTTKESALLRQAIPDLYAVAINHDYPISRVELEKITGDPRRVFTDITELHRILTPKLRSC